jgi:multicomponent Na+:H+ antiporter subunit E
MYLYILTFALLWWVVSEGTGSWVFGIPVILLAAAAHHFLQPARGLRLRPFALMRFLGFFLYESMRAGIDVARRALSPRMRLAPALIEYRLRLPAGAPQVFLVDTLSLLPGTLSTELRDDVVCLHVLNAGLPIERELRRVEGYIAALFGVALRGA